MTEEEAFNHSLAVLNTAYVMRNADANLRAAAALNHARRQAEAASRDTSPAGMERREQWAARAQRIGGIMYQHRKAFLDRNDGPTPETCLRPRNVNRLAEMLLRGMIDAFESAAGDEIARIFQAVVASLNARAQNMQGSGGGGRGGLSPRMALVHARVYRPWADAVNRTSIMSLPLTLDVVVDGASVKDASIRARVGNKRGLKMLRASLSLYGRMKDAAALDDTDILLADSLPAQRAGQSDRFAHAI